MKTISKGLPAAVSARYTSASSGVKRRQLRMKRPARLGSLLARKRSGT